MIKFFRHIRKKLLSENKFSKYLIYAIGEIVLVIIGILIALAINENVKAKNNLELRDLYIIQLNDEANRNIERLKELNDFTIEMLKEVDTVLKILYTKDYDNPKLPPKAFLLMDTDYLNPTTVTFENLKFSGDLKLFDDLNLRNSISEPYETLNDVKVVEDLDFSGFEDYYFNFLIKNVSFFDMQLTSKSYAKEIHFQNYIIARRTSLNLNKEAYERSIQSFTKLKAIFAEIKKT
ncbi:hypothetical protein [uncultured Winogradskyella sp.]|uniref:hypothetical protein n=1 Tax=uncultured Winogradskyella sp. TaxID=395353 RepID=UPI002613F54B|nr:hypothetical protein [uncultured Winogradskyella sp.]|tara:strand:- start:7500 stop:8204 length:705 start_codon:yes stop_codon:yes gene_type:complete